MKICSIHIRGYQQFENTYLDFTNPETKEPVDKTCFIGKNGTGKSTLLDLMNGFLLNFSPNSFKAPLINIKLKTPSNKIYLLKISAYPHLLYINLEIDEKFGLKWLDQIPIHIDRFSIDKTLALLRPFTISGEELTKLNNELLFHINSSDLIIHSPAESKHNSYVNIEDVPTATVNESISLFDKFPYHHRVADDNVQDFWKILIYQIKKRDSEREIFENKKENLEKTKKELIEEFEKTNPRILNKISELWNKILDTAGLEFDIKNANNPIQLTDNLHAYIRLKSNKEKIKYNQLSTGIRNFIFRVGHIYSLYFNREIKRGFLFLDEPENSLFPDFLFDLMETYQDLVLDKKGENNTQIFVSTHNPIIAAQFEPYERIILEWDETGHVKAHKGYAPVGDDPNDVLTQDFGLNHLMGKQGQEMWDEYLNLRKTLRRTTDEHKKTELISQITEIGDKYNFED